MERDEVMLMLGEIRADVKTIKENQEKHDKRLHRVELRSVASGGISGALISVGVAFASELIKTHVKP